MSLINRLRDLITGRVSEPRHYRDGLTRLPDPHPETGRIFCMERGEWITFAEEAEHVLDRYERGVWTNESGSCPRCFAVKVWGDAEFLGQRHPNRAARRRWQASAAEHQGMIAAFGKCRCGQNVQECSAYAEAAAFNGPYLARM